MTPCSGTAKGGCVVQGCRWPACPGRLSQAVIGGFELPAAVILWLHLADIGSAVADRRACTILQQMPDKAAEITATIELACRACRFRIIERRRRPFREGQPFIKGDIHQTGADVEPQIGVNAAIGLAPPEITSAKHRDCAEIMA